MSPTGNSTNSKPLRVQDLRKEMSKKSVRYSKVSPNGETIITQFKSRSNLEGVFTNKSPLSNNSEMTFHSQNLRDKLETKQSHKLLNQSNVFRSKNFSLPKKDVKIINNEKFTDHNKYSKEGLNLMTVESYKAQNKKSEVDMLFMA